MKCSMRIIYKIVVSLRNILKLTIKHGKFLGKELTPKEAIRQNILEQVKGEYRNPRTGEVISISEAIDRGFIIVTVGK